MKIFKVNAWDGEKLIGTVSMSWEGEVITSIDSITPNPEAELSVMPGLIDTHVHLIHDVTGKSDYLVWPVITPPEERVIHGVANALKGYSAGVTTLRDLAGDSLQIAIRNSFDKGVLLGPRISVHGIVSMTAGHGDLFTPPFVKERRPTADGVDECRKMVRLYARMGVDGIKITTSGGVLSVVDRSEWRNYTKEEIEAIVDEAHALGLPVAAHAHTEQGIQAAIDAGVDSLEHGTLMTEEQAAQIASKGITVAPTLLILNRIVSGSFQVPEESLEKARKLYELRNERLRKAVVKGVRFVLGTDSGGHVMPMGLQMDELREMSEVLKISSEEVMKAATSYAAKVIKRDNKIGYLRKGYLADFIIIRGRPWENISDLRRENLVAVISRGKVVEGSIENYNK
jgi:imidazolonepropionase-like amidohydrolase